MQCRNVLIGLKFIYRGLGATKQMNINLRRFRKIVYFKKSPVKQYY